MKCINKRKCLTCLVSLLVIFCLTGCGTISYDLAYQVDSKVSSFNILPKESADTAESFAQNLCVVTENIMNDEDIDMSQASAAMLADLNNKEVLYAKNVHERLYPASLTKIMTALVALQHGSLDQMLTATDSVIITEAQAQLCGIQPGDTMTLDQALHALLVYSANDAALLIAENIGGTVEHFVEMMNEEAKRIGATNTNFKNPHGLSEDEHYTTAYDLYLMFNEAIQYDKFIEIIHMANYQSTYYDLEGNAKELNFQTTNLFLKGTYEIPANVNIIGGKTGTTLAARNCLILLSKDTNGSPYISVILRSEARDVLYAEMTDLLNEINK